MKDNEKEQFASMKIFFCGFHYLIQLGADVNTTIQAWEKIIFGEDKVGAKAVCRVTITRKTDMNEIPFRCPFHYD